MSFDLMKRRNIPLPAPESEEGLTANDIMHVIRSFYFRLEKCSNNDDEEFAYSYFLELLRDYPKSMCSQHLTENMKQLIALMYFESKPETETEDKDEWPGYSYEDLSIYFCRSKATIHEAIAQKETQAKQILEEARLRGTARSMALEELLAEEKEKLKLEQNKQKNEQTNERTPKTP